MKQPDVSAARFIDHVQELRKRLFVCVFSLLLGSGIGYSILDTLIDLLSKPFGKTLFYSAPTGQLTFIIKVCVLFGVIVSLPVVIYQIARFFEPLFQEQSKHRIMRYAFMSVLLAITGVFFAYFLSLPLTLEFLTGTNKNVSKAIAPLISADEYFNFTIAYIGGFALLFQVPLVVSIINTIKPLSPGGFVSSLRYVVLISFIVSAIITPTPDPINQTIMAGPVILLYVLSGIVILSGALIKRNKTDHRNSNIHKSAISENSSTAIINLPSRKSTIVQRPALEELVGDQKTYIDSVETPLYRKQHPAAPAQSRPIDGFMHASITRERSGRPGNNYRPQNYRSELNTKENNRKRLINDFLPVQQA